MFTLINVITDELMLKIIVSFVSHATRRGKGTGRETRVLAAIVSVIPVKSSPPLIICACATSFGRLMRFNLSVNWQLMNRNYLCPLKRALLSVARILTMINDHSSNHHITCTHELINVLLCWKTELEFKGHRRNNKTRSFAKSKLIRESYNSTF